MPQRSDFDLTSESLIPLMDGIGVLEIGDEEKVSFIGAYYDQAEEFAGVYIVLASSGVSYFENKLSQVETLGFTGSYMFISEEKEHVIRKLLTSDGEWLSEYKTELPIEVLSRMVISSASDTIEDLVSVPLPNPLPEFEAVYVYYDEKTDILVSLVYMSSYGIYSRVDAGWVIEDISLPSYQYLMTIEIIPERADELIQAFDESFGRISVEVAKGYEFSELEGETEVD